MGERHAPIRLDEAARERAASAAERQRAIIERAVKDPKVRAALSRRLGDCPPGGTLIDRISPEDWQSWDASDEMAIVADTEDKEGGDG